MAAVKQLSIICRMECNTITGLEFKRPESEENDGCNHLSDSNPCHGEI